MYMLYIPYILCILNGRTVIKGELGCKLLFQISSKEPIYDQIYDKSKKKLILTGELQEGQSLPSMRQLAKDLDISVITTKRAYEELEKNGFIYSIVGKGSFVAEQNMEMIKGKKDERD